MALPVGLVPVLAFVLTVGISVPVTLGAQLFYQTGGDRFGSALRTAFIEAAVLYLVGILVVWAIAGGLDLWEIPVTLLASGLLALIILGMIPLVVGQRFIQRLETADRETALRFATYGWTVSMVVVFGIFVAPGGLLHGDLLSLGGPHICLAGFCGVSVLLVTAVLLEVGVAIFGPGAIGLVLHSRSIPTSRY